MVVVERMISLFLSITLTLCLRYLVFLVALLIECMLKTEASCAHAFKRWKIQILLPKEGHTACAFDIRLYLTPLGQARQFIETCGT